MVDTLLATLATYVPTPIAYQIAASPQLILQPHSHRLQAAVVFVDLCGFTALADELGQAGASGVEELTHFLNGYFERVITLLELYGGQVVKFSGDALIVLFPLQGAANGATSQHDLRSATLRAVQAAQTMRNATTNFADSLAADGRTALKLKVSISAGDVLMMQVGGVFGRWECVIAGDALVQLAIAAQHTTPGDIVMSDAAHQRVAGALSVVSGSGGCWRVLAAPAAIPSPLPPIAWSRLAPAQFATAESALRAYIPAAVTYRLNGGGGWLAEVRSMSIVFASIGGFDYSAPDATRWVQRFVTAAQEAVYRYEGALNKVAVDDKGTVLLALFGTPPLVHGDDPNRAVACAHELQTIARQQRLRMAIGITTGTVFAGTVGSLGRREYTVIGDRVNTAARLMQAAAVGQILCDESTANEIEGVWGSEPLAPIQLKGKPQPVPVYQPLTAHHTQSVTLAQPLFGRERELTQIIQSLIAVQTGKMRLLVVQGEAGSGKTRLIHEIQRLLQHCEITTLSGGVRFDQRFHYRAWGELLGSIFNVHMMADGVRRLQVIADRARAIHHNLREWLPLLNDIQHLGLPENERTTRLTQAERHIALQRLLADMMLARAQGGPLALLFEDMHRADPLSWTLLLDLVSALRTSPVLVILTLRPLEHIEGVVLPPLNELRAMSEYESIELDGLSHKAVVALMNCHLDTQNPPAPLLDRIMQTTNGNPGAIEQALRALPVAHSQAVELSIG